MIKRVVCISMVAFASYGCGHVDASGSGVVAGTYVREYSREILNQLSGEKVGMRTVRDTLYITSTGDGYKVANAKWRMNDYDNDGWKNMEHGENGPWPVFQAKYDESAKSLTADPAGAVPSLVFENNTISVGDKSDIKYHKVD